MSKSPITNVFVLMLENRSFDHIFGFSGLPVNGLTGDESNTLTGQPGGKPFKVTKGAVDPMRTDPNHEFLDTMEQLCGTKWGRQGTNPFPKGPYPSKDNTGFVVNYANIADEDTGLPPAGDVGDVMACCLPDEVPVMIRLAQEFAVCDQWYSSIPGPTWPNRFFAMAATSSGLDDTPDKEHILEWEIIDGFKIVHGSIFHLLKKHHHKYRLYHDSANQFAADPAPFWEAGGFSMVSALKGIFLWDVHSFENFEKDLHGHYPYQFTFIEPNYGDSVSDTYKGGSSQHPEDSIAAGEAMVAATYKAIRNSPLWNTSLLFVTYDEHGGFYDHVHPPAAHPPDDHPHFGYSMHNFDFSNFGIRVPALVISPLIAKGTVDTNLYDHTSMLKTVEDIFDLPNLTHRDKHATGLTSLLTEPKPRTDCPKEVTANVPAPVEKSARASFETAMADPTPLVSKGNVIGHLHVAMKADFELSDRSKAAKRAIKARVAAIHTKGQARAYFNEVWKKVQAKKATLVNDE